jgi:polyphosphate kinase 2
MIVFDQKEYRNITLPEYQKEKPVLQVELLKLQEWVVSRNKRLLIVFEGRDAAGKGSTIRRFIENLNPKNLRVVELGIPTKSESRNWFRRYARHFPKPGEIVFFDRSWYSRALIEPTMGYCTKAQYKYFMSRVVEWEEKWIDDGLILIKFYLSVTREKQVIRFRQRLESPLKYWKYSPNDEMVQKKWEVFTRFKEQMFERTSTEKSPWVVINSNLKMSARLNAMLYAIQHVDYEGKKSVVPLSKKRMLFDRDVELFGVRFYDLNFKQSKLLASLKAYLSGRTLEEIERALEEPEDDSTSAQRSTG